MTRIVLAHSGGLDTSVAIPWLAEKYQAEVVTVTLDLGQGRELVEIREHALAVGAVRAHVIDAREEFIRDHILPTLQGGAVHEDGNPIATALARPLIAKRLVEIAHMERASAIAHGCAGTGTAQMRLDVSAHAIDPTLDIIAPARIWGLSRADKLEYARAMNLPLRGSVESPGRTDANLWGRSVECGGLWSELSGDVYALTRSPQDCPDQPAYIEIEFEQGVPVRANGVEMPMIELIESLETIAGTHGVGRIDRRESESAVYEAPAAVVLHIAHRALEKLVVTQDVERLKHDAARVYAELVYNGLWFSEAREAIDAFVRTIQPSLTGSVRLRLSKADCHVVGCSSPFAQDDHRRTPSDSGTLVHHAAVEGFIE